VTAVAYDNPIPGFKTNNTINLRLWAAKPDREFDLQAFNTGDYVQARSHPRGCPQKRAHVYACACASRNLTTSKKEKQLGRASLQ
jgi:hypothetical protein